ncbi:PAS domain-containing protein [Methylobacillus gramineus]|uniref:PAS domain-containing protein n=1 Tax=Methylobacillus gramineus TaxID=755169 RepID=UPI001CFFDF9C|nr:PAS domain-containing protein [Methylobacillus gramineus]MCB5185230.1 PAS domain-containing protein [Methylobacillus gramineus]
MSLYLFSTMILSLIFLLVFNSWWTASAPFATHLTGMLIAGSTLLSLLLMIALIPVLTRQRLGKIQSHLHSPNWEMEVSSRLSSPAAVIEGHTVTFANKAFLNDLGMAGMSDQIVGMPLTNVVYPGDHARLAALLANLDAPAKEDTTLRLLCVDGTILSAKLSLSPIGDAAMSDRLLLQFSLISNSPTTGISFNEQFNYHLLINRIEEVVFQLQRGNKITFLNPSWEALLEYTAEESLGKSFIDFVHPEDKPLTIARLDSISKGKRLRCNEQIRLIRRNGESCWVELRAKSSSAMPNEGTSVIGTMTDINEARQVEASIKSNRHSLSSLLNNVPCMLYRRKADAGLNFEFVSDGCVDLTGYDAHELIGNPSLVFKKLLHPQDRHTWEAAHDKLMQQQQLQVVYRLHSRNGTYQWVWEHGTGIYASTGELLAVEGFIATLDRENGHIISGDILQRLQMQVAH